ncbi:hypothetical protein ABHM95_08175 [Solibacillus isronensis]|nr:hypothetical protein [Solibacillus isronensis]
MERIEEKVESFAAKVDTIHGNVEQNARKVESVDLLAELRG